MAAEYFFPMKMSDNALVQLDAAKHALAECKTAMEAKQIADMAEAARVYLERTQASVETVNRAVEIRALAERQMGEFLKKTPKATGTREQLVGPGRIGGAKEEPPTPTLAEIGITKKQSARAQKLAEIPAAEFHSRIEAVKESGERLTMGKIAEDAPRRPIKRRSPEKFNMLKWKSHTATALDLRFSTVPTEHMAEAIKYVSNFISRYTP